MCHGFVGNRMHRVRGTEGERLLLDGALPQDVDAAMTEFGFPMGPFAAADLAGLDIGWRMRKAQGLRAPIADLLCEQGRFGQKTGRGFYRYAQGSRTAEPDPEVAELIAAERARRGAAPATIGKDEIVERLMFPMINEGARILTEGIAQPARRHRRDLGLRLRLPGLARRADALCGCRRPRRASATASPPSPSAPATRRCAPRRCSRSSPMRARDSRRHRNTHSVIPGPPQAEPGIQPSSNGDKPQLWIPGSPLRGAPE